jgi:hypothetical protein
MERRKRSWPPIKPPIGEEKANRNACQFRISHNLLKTGDMANPNSISKPCFGIHPVERKANRGQPSRRLAGVPDAGGTKGEVNAERRPMLRRLAASAGKIGERREKSNTGWRRGWDSNPRDPFGPNGFQDRRLQPLGHPSKIKLLIHCSLQSDLATVRP